LLAAFLNDWSRLIATDSLVITPVYISLTGQYNKTYNCRGLYGQTAAEFKTKMPTLIML
jgi:hypothetical protein